MILMDKGFAEADRRMVLRIRRIIRRRYKQVLGEVKGAKEAKAILLRIDDLHGVKRRHLGTTP